MKKHRILSFLGLKKFTTTIIIVLISALLYTQVAAYPVSYGILVNDIQQENTYWCWAACSESILDYYSHNVSQTTFVVQVKGANVNEGASDAEVKTGLSHWDVTSTQTTSYLTYGTIKSEIYTHERPIYAGWSWSYGGGHALVIDAYDSESPTYVEYMDPSSGDKYQSTYTWFKGGTGYNHVWDGSLYLMSHS